LKALLIGSKMAEFPSLPLFTDAYIGDTAHLTNEEHGVYLRLLMFAWRSADCALPVDDKRLALMVGVTAKKWASLRSVIMAFWDETELGWQQDRLTFERQRVKVLMDQKSSAGKASARSKSRKRKQATPTGVETAVGTDGSTDDQQPEPYPYNNSEDKSSSLLSDNDYQSFLSKHPRSRDSDGGQDAWLEAIDAGADPKEIIAAAGRYAEASKRFDEDKVMFSDNWLSKRGWEKYPAPKIAPKASEAEMLAYWAGLINGPNFIAPSSINTTTAGKLIAAGLVTLEKLKSRGIAA
jgi:uncharacterized protein YdaU (DUF1376 family)